MTVFTKLTAAWSDFLEWLDGVGDDVLDFMKPAAELIAKSGGMLLIQLAEEAVSLARASGGTGDEKFALARKHVENGLKEASVDIVINAVKIAIENAVAKMNAA